MFYNTGVLKNLQHSQITHVLESLFKKDTCLYPATFLKEKASDTGFFWRILREIQGTILNTRIFVKKKNNKSTEQENCLEKNSF